jgi:UPF0716 family protein affecting phage T7 exclusion
MFAVDKCKTFLLPVFRKQGFLMIKYVLTAIVFLALELASIIYVSGEIGWLVAIYILGIEVIIGYSIVKKYGIGSLLMGGMGMQSSSFASGAVVFGVMIAFPGFFSDVLAVASLIPFVRKALFAFLKPDPELVSKIVMNQVNKQFNANGSGMNMFDENFLKNAGLFGNSDESEEDDEEELSKNVKPSHSTHNSAGRNNRKATVEDAEFREL